MNRNFWQSHPCFILNLNLLVHSFLNFICLLQKEESIFPEEVENKETCTTKLWHRYIPEQRSLSVWRSSQDEDSWSLMKSRISLYISSGVIRRWVFIWHTVYLTNPMYNSYCFRIGYFWLANFSFIVYYQTRGVQLHLNLSKKIGVIKDVKKNNY